MTLFLVIIGLISLIVLLLYWRFFYFFRNPERVIPGGNNIVSPADGTIVYIKKVKNNSVPISIKKKKEIKLDEIMGLNICMDDYYLVGIFMHPTSVHVNRAPIDGKVEKIIYTKGINLPMTALWWSVLLKIRPYEAYSSHIITNERNTIFINGQIPLFITQIADVYVNKIECWVKENDLISKGQKVGRIIMGSQVDIVFPCIDNIKITIEEGQYVKAGENIIAEFIS